MNLLKKEGLNWFNNVRNVLTDPQRFFSKMPTKGGFSDPIKIALTNYVIVAFFTWAFVPTFKNFLIEMFVVNFIGLIGLFVFSWITYLFMVLLGGRGTYEGTFRVAGYTTATSLFSWIPIVNIVAMIYGLYLNIIGISKVHKTSKWKAFLGSFLLPVILIIALAFAAILIIAIIFALMGYPI